MKFRNLVLTIALSFASAFLAIALYHQYVSSTNEVSQTEEQTQSVQFANYKPALINAASVAGIDFTAAAAKSTPAVVYIENTINNRSSGTTDVWDWLNGGQQGGVPVSSGSGVIISDDGYIITNNHVVENATEINVTLENKDEYTAQVIGTDPSTDLALIKINAFNLEHLTFADSDDVSVGEWVMAVGNPFNLTSTVTAGIVSAKGRNINLLRNRSNTSIESFIQTDAAVNPGNSGGALVNLNGDLIGINTAIYAPNGTFAGYSFAVPSNLAMKVMNDLRSHGKVQRGFLGVTISNINADLVDRYNLRNSKGVFVSNVGRGSAAENAGLQSGDVILKINGNEVNSSAQLQERVAKFRPGNDLELQYLRKGKVIHTTAILKNTLGENLQPTAQIPNNVLNEVGADFSDLTQTEKSQYDVSYGVKVTKLFEGSISKNTSMREGFVVMKVNDDKIYSVEELVVSLNSPESNAIVLEGFYPGSNKVYYYAFGL